jgi:hypothetical protein
MYMDSDVVLNTLGSAKFLQSDKNQKSRREDGHSHFRSQMEGKKVPRKDVGADALLLSDALECSHSGLGDCTHRD